MKSAATCISLDAPEILIRRLASRILSCEPYAVAVISLGGFLLLAHRVAARIQR